MLPTNLFSDIPDAMPEELFNEILSCGDVRIERIVSRGHRSPEGFWCDQAWNEWVLVIQGRAAVQIEGQPAEAVLGPGDHLFLAAHTRHRVVWTDDGADTIWLAVHIQSRRNL